MDTQYSSTGLLENLLDQMIQISVPLLETEETTVVQSSPLLSLPTNVLELMVSYVELRQRVLCIGSVCKQLRECVKSTITSIEFYKEELDGLKDNNLKYFISIYGSNITRMNFDLFRSSYIEECTQWTWRQSVVSCISLCPNLRELSVLVCNRHRLRDNDLIKIFKQAPFLKALSIDAQFLKGHCLQNAPSTLEKLELEIAHKIPAHTIKNICNLRQLKRLCLSQLLSLNDSIIYGIVCHLQKLEDLALILHGEDSALPDLSAVGLSEIGKLRMLKHLSLEGIPNVTNKFFELISNNANPVLGNLETLSLAFCNNFGSSGLKHLLKFTKLVDLNLEGCYKKDLSVAIQIIASSGNLERLLVAENCNITEQSLLHVVKLSPQLRLLDITGRNIASWEFATTLVDLLTKSSHSLLTILTDCHTPWNVIPTCEVMPVINVVHILPAIIPSGEYFANTVLSLEAPCQLNPGILSAKLRRGNRCRLLCNTNLPLSYSGDDKENSPVFSNHASPEHRTSSPTIICLPKESSAIVPGYSENYSSIENFYPMDLNVETEMNQNIFQSAKQIKFQDLKLALHNAHDVVQFLVPDSSFKIMLSPNFDGSIEAGDFVTRKSGGAPRPPIEIPEQPTVRYTRGSRSKRRPVGTKVKPQPEFDVCFTPSDFPPLGSS